MEAFLASLRNEASQYRTSAVQMDGTRRVLNVEFEELQDVVAKKVFNRRRRGPVPAKHRVKRQQPDPRRRVREEDEEQVWVTKSVPVSTRVEKRSNQIRAEFREPPPNTARAKKTPLCVRRMRPMTSDWDEIGGGSRSEEPEDFFAQAARICKL